MVRDITYLKIRPLVFNLTCLIGGNQDTFPIERPGPDIDELATHWAFCLARRFLWSVADCSKGIPIRCFQLLSAQMRSLTISQSYTPNEAHQRQRVVPSAECRGQPFSHNQRSTHQLSNSGANTLFVRENLIFQMTGIRDGRLSADAGIPAGYASLQHDCCQFT